MLLQSFSCVLRLLYPFYVFYHYSGCHAKIGNFYAENSMCAILPQNKNYFRNCLEPKNYLKVPEWQDHSRSRNCLLSKDPIGVESAYSCYLVYSTWEALAG